MRSVRERQCSKKVGFHCDVVWLLSTFVGITGGSGRESKFNPALCLELIVVVWLGSLIADSTNLSLVLPSCNLAGGLNPSKKYATVKLEIVPNFRGENKKMFELPPPSNSPFSEFSPNSMVKEGRRVPTPKTGVVGTFEKGRDRPLRPLTCTRWFVGPCRISWVRCRSEEEHKTLKNELCQPLYTIYSKFVKISQFEHIHTI